MKLILFICFSLNLAFLFGCSGGSGSSAGAGGSTSNTWTLKTIVGPSSANNYGIINAGRNLVAGGAYYNLDSNAWTIISDSNKPTYSSLTGDTSSNNRFVMVCGPEPIFMSPGNYSGGILDVQTNGWRRIGSGCGGNQSRSATIANTRYTLSNGSTVVGTLEYSTNSSVPVSAPFTNTSLSEIVSDGLKVAVWNGANQGYYFDSSNSPTTMPSQSFITDRREFLSAGYQGKFYFFGGYFHTSPSVRTWQYDGLIFDSNTNSWSQMSTVGSPPEFLYYTGTTRAVINNKIIVIGKAVNNSNNLLHYIYDIDSNTWSQGPTLNRPIVGNSYRAFQMGNEVVVVYNASGTTYEIGIYKP